MQQRLTSLDVFRGMTVALMIIVNNPGDWDAIYTPLEHAQWHGCTPTDLVFPFFLFIVGVSIVFALSPMKATIEKHDDALQKIIFRALKLFSLGLFLNFYSKIDFGFESNFWPRLIICSIFAVLMLGDWPQKIQRWTVILFLVSSAFLLFFEVGKFGTARILGVLQRISIVYLVVSYLFLKTSVRTQIIIFASILIGYWAIMALVPVPGFGPANFDKATNFASWLDSVILKEHNWASAKTWDPEGILSTLPAICTGLAGVFAGSWLKENRSSMLSGLLIVGATATIWGLVWGEVFPINKALWTSSYVLFVGGLATMLLGVFYWLIDVKKIPQGIYLFFLVYGVNAMTVFFGSGLIPRLLGDIKIQGTDNKPIGSKQWLYENLILPHFELKINASLAAALTFALIWFVVLYILWRKKIIVKV
jgi:predicted acyltransferase